MGGNNETFTESRITKSGTRKTFPRDALFGPTTVQGFGIMHLWYHQQLLHHLIALFEHLQQQTMTGQVLVMSHEQLRLEMGTLGLTMTDIQYKRMKDTVTKTWITDL